MDTETWNETIRLMNAANRRAERMGRLSMSIGALATEAAELEAEAIAGPLHQLERETFHLAALTQERASKLLALLEIARAAGEEPPD